MRSWKQNQWLKRALLALACLEILYLAGTAVFLNGQMLKRLINTKPQEVLIEWQSAFSPFPGFVFVRGITGRIQDSGIQLAFQLPVASVGIFLPSLMQKEFRTTHIRGQGLAFQLRLRRDPKDIQSSHYLTLPPIPGLPGFEREPEPSPQGKGEPWHIRLGGIALERVREIWIEEYRFAGQARVGGGFHLIPGRLAEVFPSYVFTRDGEVFLGGNRVADEVNVDIEAKLEEFLSSDVSGMKIFNQLTGSVRGEARIDNIRFLNYYLRRAKWLRLDGGAGRLTVKMQARRGVFDDASKLEIASRNIEAHLWRQTARGEGIASWHVLKNGDRKGVLKVELGDYEITHPDTKDSRIVGKHLLVEAHTPDLKIEDAFERLGVKIRIPEASITNLRYFNAYLPKSSGLKILDGSGTVQGHLDADAGGRNDSGELVFEGKNARVGYDQLTLEGDLKLRARLDKGDMTSRSFVLSGTTLDLRDLVARREGQAIHEGTWWGRADVEQGKLQVTPTSLEGRLRLEGKNARPIIAMFTAAKGLPGIVEDVLAFEGLWATARLRLNDDEFHLRKLRAKGKGATLKGWLDKTPESQEGGLLLSVGPFAAGIELNTTGTEVKLNDAYGWYENLEKRRASD